MLDHVHSQYLLPLGEGSGRSVVYSSPAIVLPWSASHRSCVLKLGH